ncbi:maturation protein [ssRNA phage Esthiorhiza.2_47]|uniref:Maturation protein n=2 Tax=Leviviricetes TaxID=2842243 RepID=A0A8S5L312_9VIRU|nr:maturation protein [ssRNA phage Esthiorhiza.2_47]QDH87851.1 MAG: hypothetical protein H2RhizoLitter7338_000003 [Leviviridae sp.]DAD51546.1 TPA_asm: maturation protein [ssRNA phage Esthiorhiza.2_47]
MSSRYRIKTVPISGDWHQYVSGSPTTISHYSTDFLSEECWDEVGSPNEPHNLEIKKLDFSAFTPITGTSQQGAWAGSYYSNGCSGNLALLCGSHLTVALPSNGADTTKLLARTNPGRSYMSIPTLIQDVIDIPKMLADWTKLLTDRKHGGTKLDLKALANQHLAISFGVLPLIEDIRKLGEVHSAILQRKKELQRLYNVGGLRRRLKLGKYKASQDTKNVLITSYPGGYVQGNLQRTTTVERWGTVRWLPSGIPKYHPGEEELFREARRLIYGLSAESFAEGIWDVIPWTWVIDWFANIGEFSQAFSNTVQCFSYRPCIMTKTETVSTFTPTFRSQGIEGGSGTITLTSKTRVHDVIPTPATAVLPMLDLRRLSILGSLAVQKLK